MTYKNYGTRDNPAHATTVIDHVTMESSPWFFEGREAQYRNPKTVLGTAVHKFCEAFHSDEYHQDDSPGEIFQRIYDVEIEDQGALPINWKDGQREKLTEEGRVMCEAYAADPRNQGQVIGTEFHWVAELGGVCWAGCIDRLDRLNNGGIALYDVKSGETAGGEAANLAFDLQQSIYALAIKEAKFIFAGLPGIEVTRHFGRYPEKIVEIRMRDYIPYKRKTKKQGKVYNAGDLRGEVFYEKDLGEGTARENLKLLEQRIEILREIGEMQELEEEVA